MWNEILKKIDYLKTPSLATLSWGDNRGQVHLVSEGINLVYRFEKNHQNYYLRMTHASLRSESELIAAIAYQQYLFLQGVPVCAPIISNSGRWIEKVAQGDEQFLAHVCQEAPGIPIHFDHKNLNLYKCWGKVLGKLHKAAKNYQQGKHIYTNWKKSLDELYENASSEFDELKDTLKEISHFLELRGQVLTCDIVYLNSDAINIFANNWY